jgi:uncharacterized protein YndB with AHSA1/START domain
METVVVRRTIPAPISETFDWISNGHNYTQTAFFLHARLVREGREAPFGTGAVRRFTFPIGVVQEEITQYEPPYSLRYQVVKSVPPVNHQGGAVRLTETPDGTEVLWTSTVELRIPILAEKITHLVVPAMFGRAFSGVLDAAELALRARARS